MKNGEPKGKPQTMPDCPDIAILKDNIFSLKCLSKNTIFVKKKNAGYWCGH